MSEKIETLGYKLVYNTSLVDWDDVVQEALEAHEGNIEYTKKDSYHSYAIRIVERYRYRATKNKLLRGSKTYTDVEEETLSRFGSKPTAQELIHAITSATGSSPSRTTPSSTPSSNKPDREKERLRRENKELRQNLSEMKSQMNRMEEMIQGGSEPDESHRTNDRIDDIFEDADLDEPEI